MCFSKYFSGSYWVNPTGFIPLQGGAEVLNMPISAVGDGWFVT